MLAGLVLSLESRIEPHQPVPLEPAIEPQVDCVKPDRPEPAPAARGTGGTDTSRSLSRTFSRTPGKMAGIVKSFRNSICRMQTATSATLHLHSDQGRVEERRGEGEMRNVFKSLSPLHQIGIPRTF